MLTEALATALFCASIGGVEEARNYYPQGYIITDCETSEEAIEAGLDKRSSLDSIQQAVFASTLNGKTPIVVIYDTDGVEGKYEFRIRKACEELGVEYRSISVEELQKWKESQQVTVESSK